MVINNNNKREEILDNAGRYIVQVSLFLSKYTQVFAYKEYITEEDGTPYIKYRVLVSNCIMDVLDDDDDKEVVISTLEAIENCNNEGLFEFLCTSDSRYLISKKEVEIDKEYIVLN